MGCFYGPGGHGDSDGNRCREKRGRSDKLFLPLPLVTLRYVSDIRLFYTCSARSLNLIMFC